MIKIRVRGHEFTLNGRVWTGENQKIADMFARQAASRPYLYERREEYAIARYIVEKNKHQGAEIIYDNEGDEPTEVVGDFY